MAQIIAIEAPHVSLLASGQVVTSVRSVIKELVENSLDAKASTVEVRIHGVDKITVRDDGPGIDEDNMAMVCKRYCTSKLRGFDLSELTTMGFRGEALSSLCAVAEVTMTTRTAGESIARAYEFSSMGEILRQSTTAASIGTTVQVTKLFGNIPVRRQVIVKGFNTSVRRQIAELIASYGMLYPAVRFTFKCSDQSKPFADGGDNIQKPPVESVLDAVRVMFGSPVANTVRYHIHNVESLDIMIECLLPTSDPVRHGKSKRSAEERLYFAISGRPVSPKSDTTVKSIIKSVRSRYEQVNSAEDGCKKIPLLWIHLIIPPDKIDVNVEPNKSTVMVHSPAEIEKGIEQLLDLAYPLLPDEVVFDETPESPNSSSPLLAPSNPDDVQSMETRSIFIPSSSLSALPRWSAEKSVFSDSTRYTNNSTVETVEQPKTASNATSILNLMIEDDIEIDLAEWSAGNVPTLVKGGGGANVNVGQQNSQPVDVRSCKPWLDRGWFDRIGHGIAEKAPSERPQMQNWERRSLASSVAVEDERQCRIQDFWAGTTTTKSASSSDTRTQQPNDNTLPSTPKQVARIATPTAKSTAHVTNSPANIHTPKGVLDSAGRRSDGSRQSTLDHFLSGKHAQASSPTPSRKPRNIVTPQKLQRLSKSDGGFRSLVTSEIAAIVPALDLIRRQHRETRMQVRSWVKDRGYGRDQRKRKAINAIGRVPGHREDLWSFPWLIQANGRMFLVNMFRMWETLLMKRLTERCIHSITKTFETLNTREPLNGSTKSGRLEDVTLVSFSGEFSYEPAVLTLDRENGIRDLLSVRSTPASVQLAQYVKSTSKVLAKHQAGVASNSIFNVQAEHILVQHAVENFVSGFGIEPQRDSVWYSPDEGGEIAMALE